MNKEIKEINKRLEDLEINVAEIKKTVFKPQLEAHYLQVCGMCKHIYSYIVDGPLTLCLKCKQGKYGKPYCRLEKVSY